MGVAATVVLLLIVLLSVGLLIVLLVVRARRQTVVRIPQTMQGPAYRQNIESIEYYKQEPGTQQSRSADSDPEPKAADPRKMPLPRCPKCGAAIAYTDERCPKCARTLERT